MTPRATPPNKEIRILIADDHPIVREGLAAILALQNDLKLVGEAQDGEEACCFTSNFTRHPHPGPSHAEEGRPAGSGQLMPQRPRPHVIVLTNSAKSEDLGQALTAGAKGYLLKGAKRQQVWDTIREVFAGRLRYPLRSP